MKKYDKHENYMSGLVTAVICAAIVALVTVVCIFPVAAMGVLLFIMAFSIIFLCGMGIKGLFKMVREVMYGERY